MSTHSHRVGLLGTWSLLDAEGTPLAVRRPVARVITFVAVRGGVQERRAVSGSLWPDVCDQRASSNLRSTLWHCRAEIGGVVDSSAMHVWLGPDVIVDLDAATRAARSMIAGERPADNLVGLLLEDMLPEWDEEWLALPRFLHRQLRLQALDRAIASDLAAHAPAPALALARLVLAREPLRASTHRLLEMCHDPSIPSRPPAGSVS